MTNKTTIFSLFLSLLALVFPFLIFDEIVTTPFQIIMAILILIAIFAINFYSALRGDRAINVFAAIVTLIALFLFTIPLWRYIF
ncbi:MULTISPECIES: hypothetical protein [Staphylococcus]|nr:MULTISPECIES: hypothetical protein [Staphylococcus]EHM69850.1 hypothetical protein SEVCU012_2229 [Staphylococcus pettenkoferi VCU012]MBX8992735.1 hypothetical protein [Staphylococcus pettenkoferi]MCI2791118.1 hypothetical protein [Staphylococcus pettenkoferi]MCI2804406.1 hypothetical protein [Staphylococcus pettenkoferi]MCY1564342.1 hypothetical protein [Staphylococcus pettenkoferi]